MWSGINAKQGDFISIGGSDAVLITEVTDATHLKVAPWPAAAMTSQPYIIYQNYVGRVVGVAAAEDVGDMLEMLHVDGLPFIVGPSETVPDPSFGDDGQMAFKPDTGEWWTKTGGAWVASPGLSSDASKVLKAGDTMTGGLSITAGGLSLTQFNSAIELGSPGTSNTPLIDFHSASFSNDYDVRLIAGGGTTGVGTGTLTINAALVTTSKGNFGSATQWQTGPLAVETLVVNQFPVAIKAVNRGIQYLMTDPSNIYAWFMQGTITNSIGNISGNTTTTFYNTSSDGRRKPTREPFGGLDIINALNPVRHNWDNEPGQWSYGVIAQEAVDVLPQMISRGDDDPDKRSGDEGFTQWSADYSQAVPVLIRAIQELTARIAALEAAMPPP